MSDCLNANRAALGCVFGCPTDPSCPSPPPLVAAVANLFLGLAVFGGKCWDRDWLMYPNYNFLSWSYYMAIFSCGFHTIAALLYGMVSR